MTAGGWFTFWGTTLLAWTYQMKNVRSIGPRNNRRLCHFKRSYSRTALKDKGLQLWYNQNLTAHYLKVNFCIKQYCWFLFLLVFNEIIVHGGGDVNGAHHHVGESIFLILTSNSFKDNVSFDCLVQASNFHRHGILEDCVLLGPGSYK